MSNVSDCILQEREIDAVSGAFAANCMYSGKEYSVGAVINIGGNLGQRCMYRVESGTAFWSDPFPQKFNNSDKHL